MVEYRFNNVAVLKSQTLLKERLQQILTISLSKFFRTAIFKNRVTALENEHELQIFICTFS